MFGSHKTTNAIETMGTELQLLKDEINALKKVNEQAIINKETITKFLSDMHQIVRISSVQEAKKINEVKKKKGRPKKAA